MAEVDLDKVRVLADSAQQRANTYHSQAVAHKAKAMGGFPGSMLDYHASMNDWAYWIGHANAYKGIIAMAELATVVEDEMDATPQCP